VKGRAASDRRPISMLSITEYRGRLRPRHPFVLKGVSIDVRGARSRRCQPTARKTTTLKAISGVSFRARRGHQGNVQLAERRIDGMPAHGRRLAWSGLEGRRVFENRTTEEVNRSPAGTAERRVGQAGHLDGFILTFAPARTARQLAGYLSGGEQQMLATPGPDEQAQSGAARRTVAPFAPMLVEEIFGIVGRLVRQEQLSVLLVEQNAAMALAVAEHGYVMENGRIVLEGPAAKLRDNSDIKEFYLGLNEGGTRKSYHDTKHYKRRKRWLS
jgi:branched-chain amino acid transport system ATP-binding protein